MEWLFTSRGKLYAIADLTRALQKLVFPLAWGLAFPHMDGDTLKVWILAAVLYLVHDLTLSIAVRRDRDEARNAVILTTVDGVTLEAEDAERIRAIIDEARVKAAPQTRLQ